MRSGCGETHRRSQPEAPRSSCIRFSGGSRDPTQTPYRALFFDPRPAGDAATLHAAERAAARDERTLAEYRAGRASHPLQPFAEWRACEAVAERLGAVLIAGCRDAQAARQLGFVGVHGLGAAVEMAHGRGAERIGYLLSPPYFPLRRRRLTLGPDHGATDHPQRRRSESRDAVPWR